MLIKLIRKFGRTKTIAGISLAVALVSLVLADILLLIFQGYIDFLGIVCPFFVPLFATPLLLTKFVPLLIELDVSQAKLLEKNRQLEEALSTVNTLGSFLPMCTSCKSIRDDKGLWKQVEVYISEHSDADFTHGICPECMEKLYPGFADRKKHEQNKI